MNRDLVTGGAGFLGPHLVRALLAAGRQVTVLDDFSTGSRARLLPLLGSDALTLVEGSVLDRPLLGQLVGESARVFNLACVSLRRTLADPLRSHAVNATGVVNLMEAARQAKVERIVHMSSSEVYGPAQRTPIDETHPTTPTSLYGAAKLAGESYGRAYQRSYGLPVVIVRPFNVYGPGCYIDGDNMEVIPRFIRLAMEGAPLEVLGDGAQTRAFTFVDDTIDGFLRAGSAAGIEGETINLGHPRDVSIREIATRVSALVAGGKATLRFEAQRPGEVRRAAANSDKAAALLGWKPAIELDDGLKRLHAWLAAPGDLLP